MTLLPLPKCMETIVTIIMQLVEEDSACLSVNKKRLDASHSLMNKFSDPGDPNYTVQE